MPSSIDSQLHVRQIQVLADGACDAMGLVFFENSRGEERKSHPWYDRQMRKVEGALRACDEMVRKSHGAFLVGNEFSVADIAVGAMLGMMNMVETKFGILKWLEVYPELRKYVSATLLCASSFSFSFPSLDFSFSALEMLLLRSLTMWVTSRDIH